VLVGGCAGGLINFLGAGLPPLDGAILLLEGPQNPHFDRQLAHLMRAGVLARVRAVAVGRFAGFGKLVDRGWTVDDVLADRLGRLRVPVLSGLPTGPGSSAVPIGVPAELDAGTGELVVAPGVR
jgi:muramoyltetrapeptide carboxypeptidase